MASSTSRAERVHFLASMLLAFVGMVGWGVQARAQSAFIAIQTPDGDCTVIDSGPGTKTVEVRLYRNLGSTAVRFRIEPSPGVTMTIVSESHPIPNTVGDVTSGLTVCFNPCTAGDVLVLATVTYATLGTSDNCSEIRVVPHPDAETVDQNTCFGPPLSMYVLDLRVARAPGGCPLPCADTRIVPGTPQLIDCQPVSIAPSTWGSVKALYR